MKEEKIVEILSGSKKGSVFRIKWNQIVGGCLEEFVRFDGFNNEDKTPKLMLSNGIYLDLNKIGYNPIDSLNSECKDCDSDRKNIVCNSIPVPGEPAGVYVCMQR
jgi:hypothetical protein